jgi:pimeloyl-ACP methyl ester carboxylesterase
LKKSPEKKYSKKHLYLSVGRHRLAAELISPVPLSSKKGCPHLIFLHEGLGSIAQWRDFPTTLCAMTGLPGLVYERLGYGQSDARDTGISVNYIHEEALTALPAVLARLNISDAILIGHSDGGSIALIYAACHGNNVRGVITEAAHVFVEDVTLAGIRRAVELYETTGFKERLFQYHGANTDAMFHAWADTWLDPMFRNWNIEEYLPRITCPLLVIQGAKDEYGTGAQVEAIVKGAASKAESVIIPDCGHVPHLQARETALSEMSRFIREKARLYTSHGIH